MLKPPGLDRGPVGPEQPGKLPGVRRDQRGRRAGQQLPVCREQGDPVRIDEDGEAARQYLCQQPCRRGLRIKSRAGYPCLNLPCLLDRPRRGHLGTDHGQHRLRPVLPHDRRGLLGREQPDHPGTAAHRAADGQVGGAGEPAAAGQDAEHAAPVLVGFRRRAGQQGGDVRGLQRGGAGRGEVGSQPDVDQLGRPGAGGAGVDEQAGLPGAERHGHVRPDGGAGHLASVGIDPAGQVNRDHQRARRRRPRGKGRARFAQPALPADAEHAVDDEIRGVDQVSRGVAGPASLVFPASPATDQPSAGAAQRRHATGVGTAAGGDRRDDRAATGQQRARVERVAAVVPGPGQDDDP